MLRYLSSLPCTCIQASTGHGQQCYAFTLHIGSNEFFVEDKFGDYGSVSKIKAGVRRDSSRELKLFWAADQNVVVLNSKLKEVSVETKLWAEEKEYRARMILQQLKGELLIWLTQSENEKL